MARGGEVIGSELYENLRLAGALPLDAPDFEALPLWLRDVWNQNAADDPVTIECSECDNEVPVIAAVCPSCASSDSDVECDECGDRIDVFDLEALCGACATNAKAGKGSTAAIGTGE
jgi:hypothetical protein